MKTVSTPSQPVTFVSPNGKSSSPDVDRVVFSVISRVADKWTMLVLETLAQHGVLRFTRIGELVGAISQKMLTKTLRQMEQDGFVTRTAYPEVPPRVEYALTELGLSLGAAFCGVWEWAEEHHAELGHLRTASADARAPETPE
jgi:DNA-binding HxlR family transcriptional regulator